MSIGVAWKPRQCALDVLLGIVVQLPPAYVVAIVVPPCRVAPLIDMGHAVVYDTLASYGGRQRVRASRLLPFNLPRFGVLLRGSAEPVSSGRLRGWGSLLPISLRPAHGADLPYLSRRQFCLRRPRQEEADCAGQLYCLRFRLLHRLRRLLGLHRDGRLRFLGLCRSSATNWRRSSDRHGSSSGRSAEDPVSLPAVAPRLFTQWPSNPGDLRGHGGRLCRRLDPLRWAGPGGDNRFGQSEQHRAGGGYAVGGLLPWAGGAVFRRRFAACQ